MRLTPALRAVAILAVAVTCLLPAAGCGGKSKKKGGLTIAQRLEKARAEKTPDLQARELVKVAQLQVKGDRTGAVKTVGEAHELMKTRLRFEEEKSDEENPEPSDAPQKDKLLVLIDGDAAAGAPRLIEIVDAYLLCKDKPLAGRVAKEARATIAALDDPLTKAEFYAQLGALYAAKETGLGDGAAGEKVLKEAEKLAMTVQEGFRAKALAAVAIGYADAGLAAEAKDMIADLEKMAGELEEPRRKAEALAVAATVRAASGEDEKAATLLADAAKAARGIEAAANRTYALLSVGKAALAAKDRKLAKSLAADADKSAAKIGDPEQNKEAVQKVRAFERLVEKS